MNWSRISATGLYTFFVVFAAEKIASPLDQNALAVSLLVAFVQAGLAFSHEWLVESGGDAGSVGNTLKSVLVF